MTECALVVQNYWMQKSYVDAEEEKGVVVEDDPLCWMCAALDLTTLSGKNSVSLPCWFSYHHLLVFFASLEHVQSLGMRLLRVLVLSIPFEWIGLDLSHTDKSQQQLPICRKDVPIPNGRKKWRENQIVCKFA